MQTSMESSDGGSTVRELDRQLEDSNGNLMLRLYQSLVRPKLELHTGMAAILKKDTDLLEKVQRRATRLMTSDRPKCLSYNNRLQKFGLTTLETRRLRGDLIEACKMFQGF